MTNWRPGDIPWGAFQPKLVDPDLVALVKAASMVESNAPQYAKYLCNVFHNDPDFNILATDWAAAEVQHGQTLGRWAALADPGFNYEKSFETFTAGFHIAADAERSVRGSLAGEMLARCVVETGTSSHYTAIRWATREPVLQYLCARIAADETRHYKTFYELSKRYMETEKLDLHERLRVVAGRVMESDDDELAYAYYAANKTGSSYCRKESNRSYARRAYPLYPRDLVDRMGAMLLQLIGLPPRGVLNRLLGFLGHRFLQGRAKAYARKGY
jgi:hypothetical protein